MEFALQQLPLSTIESWARDALRASVHVAGAALLSLIIVAVTRRLGRYSRERITGRGGVDSVELYKQTATIMTTARRILLVLVWALALILTLEELGFAVKPLLAGAGVAGIALGFAAQSLLKDWINGFLFITEGQIRINDVIRVGELSGTVEQISLRTLSLRGLDGALHVISNGSITSFSNQTMLFSYYVMDVNVEYRDDPDRMIALMKEVDEELRADAQLGSCLLDPVEILGVDRFAEQGVTVKARIKTVPGQQWAAGREFLRRLKRRCDASGVSLATAQRAVQLFEPEDRLGHARLLQDPQSRDALKALLREVLGEPAPPKEGT